MATLQGKAVKNTYRQVLQIGANNVGVSGTLQPVQDGAGVNTALSLSTLAATVNGDLTVTGDLIITGGGLQIKELIDDTVAALIKNGTGITWTYNDAANSLTGNFTGTTSVVPEGSNLYYTQGRFDSAFAAKSTTNLAEGTNLYFTEARGNANFATNLAASDTDDLDEGVTNLYFSNSRARLALSVTAGTGISYNNTTGVFNLAAIPNASLSNSSITINSQSVALGGSVTLTTTNIAEGTNLYWTDARFDSRFGTKTTTNLAEGTNLYYTQARFNSALAAKTTSDLAEGTNLYYTDARARLALSSSATGLSYANNSGVFSLTAGYAIPTTVKLGQYDIAYNRSIVSAAVTGTSTKTLSLTQQDANVITATWTDQGITTINGTANQIAATTVGNTTTLAFTNDVTMPNNLVVSGNLTINGTATYVNTESISSKDPLFEVANTNNTTDAVDIGYYGRYYDAVQERVEFTGLFRDASDAGKFKIFSGLVDEPTNVVNTTGTGYTVATLVANVDGNLAGTANAANILSTARTIAASGDATWSVSFNGSANVSSALTLANTGVTATTYGTSTAVPTIAVDSKGRITSASNTNIAFPVTTVNGQAGTVVLTTSNITEGSNQYFTSARAQASITGGASSVVTADLTASRVLVSDGSGKIAASGSITTTELGYLSGVTSSIQTQLNGKLNLTGGTLTGGLSGTTGSFSGILTTPQVKAATSAGLSINANSGTQVADFGAGGSANITFFGGLAGTSATFSSTLGVTGALSGTSATFTSNVTAAGYLTSGNGGLQLNTITGVQSQQVQYQNNGTTRWQLYLDAPTNSFNIFNTAQSANNFTLSSTGAATFSSSVTAASGIFSNGTSGINQLLTLANSSGSSGDNGSSIRFTGFSNGILSEIRGIGRPANTSAGRLQFWVNDSSNVLQNRMSISEEGNVAIGTTTPNNTANYSTLSINGTSGGQITWQTGGNLVGYAYNTASSLVLGANANNFLAFDTNGSERARITSGGDLCVGGTVSSGLQRAVAINGSTSAGVVLQTNAANKGYFYTSGGSAIFIETVSGSIVLVPNSGSVVVNNLGTGIVYSNGGSLTSTNPSDERLKDNITDISWGLSDILKLRPVSYQWKDDKINQGVQFGFIAQEVQEVMPEAIKEFGEDVKYLGLEKDAIYATLVKAIQELESRIKDLEAK